MSTTTVVDHVRARTCLKLTLPHGPTHRPTNTSSIPARPSARLTLPCPRLPPSWQLSSHKPAQKTPVEHRSDTRRRPMGRTLVHDDRDRPRSSPNLSSTDPTTPQKAEHLSTMTATDHVRARPCLHPTFPRDRPTDQPTHQGSRLRFVPDGVAGDFAAGVFNPATPRVPC